MPLPWIKMWLEALDDPKLTRLSLAERGAWWDLLKLAGKCDVAGKIMSGGGALGLDEIADALHVKTPEDRQSLESMIAKMKERGSLIWNDKVLTVVHYEERQRIPPSARPEAVADRVRRYRERRKKTGNGEAVQLLPKAGEDKGVKQLLRDSNGATHPPRDSKVATRSPEVPPVTSQDEAVLAVWSGVKGFPRDSKVATRFLNKLRAEFPDVDILNESKKWAAAKLSKPLTKRSMPFKQLLVWMMKAREFAQEKEERHGRPGEHRQDTQRDTKPFESDAEHMQRLKDSVTKPF